MLKAELLPRFSVDGGAQAGGFSHHEKEQNCPVRWLSKAVQRRWELSGSKELVEPQERQECTAWKREY